MVETYHAPVVGLFLDPATDGFEPEGNEFLKMEVALVAAVESISLRSKLGTTPPGQIFIGCLERALYLLAVNGKPSEIGAVTVSVEAFADFLKSFSLVGSHD